MATLTNPAPQTAEFHGVPVHVIDHAGKRWLTAEEIGLCLGYNPANAGQGIRNLYNRHVEEFTQADSTQINLICLDGKNREARVFSATGCVLLSMFSNTMRAKEFRAWAKQVLVGGLEAAPPAAPGSLDRQLSSIADSIARLAEAPETISQNIGALTECVAGLAVVTGRLAEASERHEQRLDVVGRYISLLEVNQKGTVKITRAVEAEVLKLKAQGMANVDIARMLRISASSVSLLVNGKYTWSAQQALPGAAPGQVQALLERMVEEERAKLLARPAAALTEDEARQLAAHWGFAASAPTPGNAD